MTTADTFANHEGAAPFTMTFRVTGVREFTRAVLRLAVTAKIAAGCMRGSRYWRRRAEWARRRFNRREWVW